MSRLKQDSVEYVLISADDGFYQTFSESNGHQFSNLTKAAVDVNDSGSYKCEVQSGLDASFSVEVNIIQGDCYLELFIISGPFLCLFWEKIESDIRYYIQTCLVISSGE